jgi:hypothetical protein
MFQGPILVYFRLFRRFSPKWTPVKFDAFFIKLANFLSHCYQVRLVEAGKAGPRLRGGEHGGGAQPDLAVRVQVRRREEALGPMLSF